jgi:cation diffusion facilitator CzcD-associated flavoprotein CzcO
VQAVPKLAEACEHLYVFQRTASTISARNQRETDPAWFAAMSARPGWQQERVANFGAMVTGERPDVDLVADGWTELLADDTRRLPKDETEAERLELLDFERMQKIRDRIDSTVLDPTTAEKLKPWYKLSCKRPCFHDEYLPTFNRDNVTLVDTDGRGVERITERGVVANGEEIEVDVLVFASGFEVGSPYTHRLGFDPKGEGGVALSDAWRDGPATSFGVMSRGFPNLLMNSPIQGAMDINFTFVLGQAAKHIAHIISEASRSGATKVQPTAEAQDAWLAVILGAITSFGAYYADCTPGYLNNEGAPAGMDKIKGSPYIGSAYDWAKILETWRDDGGLAGFELSS